MSAQRAEADAWIEKENACFQRADYDSALLCLAIADSLAGDDDTIRAYTSGERSVILSNMGRMEDGIEWGRKALSASERINDYETQTILYSSLGVSFRRIGMNDSALVYYNRGIELGMKHDAKDCVANLFNNIAVVYAQTDREREAIDYTKKAELWAKEANDSSEMYSALATRAAILVRQGRYSEAKTAIEPLFETIMRLGRWAITLKCAAPLLTSYVELGMANKAESIINSMQPVLRNATAASIGGRGILEIQGKIYRQRGDFKREMEVFNRIDSLNQQNQSSVPHELLYNKAECYDHLGNTRKALSLMKEAYAACDSLKNSDSSRQLSEFSIRYKTQEKELELAREKEKRATQTLRLLVVIGVLVVVCGILSFVVVLIRYRRKSQKAAYELAIKRRFIEGMEDERTRLARELHDSTCNELLALSMKMNATDNDCLPMVREIRDNVRRISHELMPPRFSTIDLNTVLGEYTTHYPIADCAISYTSTEQADWSKVPENVAYEVYRVAQEALGNAAKHAKAKNIEVSLQLKDNTLQLQISNDGVGEKTENDSHGIGSRTMKDRIEGIGGTIQTRCDDKTYNTLITIQLTKKS